MSTYNKLLELFRKLKYFESKGKVKYETPIDKIIEIIESDKNNLKELE